MGPRPQQAAVIPFRRNGDAISVCLITSASSQSWGIPKGTIERGSSARETALEEAWEEAGLQGRIVGKPLGTYDYEKAGAILTVVVFIMEVELEAEHWEEQDVRRRRWVKASEAGRMLDGHPARALVDEACRSLLPVQPE